MSAIRYFLGGHVRLTYLDRAPGFADLRGGYRCFVKPRDGKGREIIVGEPRVLDGAVDSPEAFDDAARAAIAFAEDEGVSLEYDAETVGKADRVAIRRRP